MVFKSFYKVSIRFDVVPRMILFCSHLIFMPVFVLVFDSGFIFEFVFVLALMFVLVLVLTPFFAETP